jgi:hypothetical protein
MPGDTPNTWQTLTVFLNSLIESETFNQILCVTTTLFLTLGKG